MPTLGRIVLLLVIGFAIYLLFRGFFRSQVKGEPPAAAAPGGEKMVACENCGVNLPASEAVRSDGRTVCRDNPNCRPPA
jgi:hypothetical protein